MISVDCPILFPLVSFRLEEVDYIDRRRGILFQLVTVAVFSSVSEAQSVAFLSTERNVKGGL